MGRFLRMDFLFEGSIAIAETLLCNYNRTKLQNKTHNTLMRMNQHSKMVILKSIFY